MKIVVSVVIHNREENLKTWCNIWKQCQVDDAELRFIHNVHDIEKAKEFKRFAEENGAVYVQRLNRPGMDIGALQDVAKKRLPGFEQDFEYLAWFTDDCFPMKKDFLSRLFEPFHDPMVSISCYEISQEVRPHVRTTGFCIRESKLRTIDFLKDPVATKEDCYQFEHRSQRNLYSQIVFRQEKIVQIAPVLESPIWDSGRPRSKSRIKEMKQNFNNVEIKIPKVVIVAPCHKRHPVVASSMICQTYDNWELYLVHHGESEKGWQESLPKDSRIKVSEWGEGGNYGHPVRQYFLNRIKKGEIIGDYVLITNDDNYHAPVYLERLIAALESDPTKIAAYCGDMVHDYKDYGVIPTRPALGFIDCASVLVRANAAAEVGWPDFKHSSDWTYFQNIANRFGGWTRWARVPGCLLTHN